MLDFNRLVLRPAMRAFGRPVQFTPLVSQPGIAAFPIVGVYDEQPVGVDLEGDGVLSSVTITLGIRLADFVAAPQQGDKVTIPAHRTMPALGNFLVDGSDTDGQGHAILTLKKITAP